jgi:putative alpha-1,2-mannosidase
LLGNEPNLNVPWLYDWAGRPYKTQAGGEAGVAPLRLLPGRLPGNDDLGTLSSWYVLGALGLYPRGSGR